MAGDAEAAEREAIAAIGALGERELVAVKAWAASACEGPKPEPDAEARRVLADRLMAVIEAREAAEKAASKIGSGAAHSRAADAGETGKVLNRRKAPRRDCLVALVWLFAFIFSFLGLPTLAVAEELGRVPLLNCGDYRSGCALTNMAIFPRSEGRTVILPTDLEPLSKENGFKIQNRLRQ